MAVSRQSRAAPRAPQAMTWRASVRKERGAFRPMASGRNASPGNRTSSITISPVDEARNDSLCRTSFAVTPGESIGTTKPRIGPSPRLPLRAVASVRAQITATSATGAFVIHILVPRSTQPSPSDSARVFIDAPAYQIADSDFLVAEQRLERQQFQRTRARYHAYQSMT